jgi:predicted Ser/Thr protein kinase
MNPEDNKNIHGFQSLTDRIEFINISYVLDSATEVEIYKAIFGKHIEDSFLPRVLENFARVIISSRLNEKSPAMLDWIGDPKKYRLYCDENLHLLKMTIYTGLIPSWLDEDDRRGFTAKRRRKIIAEAETEGHRGFSGRDAIDIFHDLYSAHAREDQLITMDTLCAFFTRARPDLAKQLPSGFLDSLRRMYNYQILQEVKESLYYYNEEQIARDIKHYVTAVNHEIGAVADCFFTGESLNITREFLEMIEDRLFLVNPDKRKREELRQDVLKEYTTNALTREILMEGKEITETRLFALLNERCIHNLKKKALDPFVKNENFRRAIKDIDTEEFKTYDKRIRGDVMFLIYNMKTKFGYTQQGANEVCIYVIDSDLTTKFK